jgi:hypothetical protein
MWQKVSWKKSKKAKRMTKENDAILLIPMSIAFLMHLKMK